MPEVETASRTTGSPTQNVTELLARLGGSTLASSSNTLWMPLVTAALVLLTGVLALSTGQPWLFVALGPTVVIIAGNPGHPTARVHNIVVGHLVAIGCAWVAVMLVGAHSSSAFLAWHEPGTVRVWAAAISIALMVVIQPALRAYHPPAAATALLLALGISPLHVKPLGAMFGGVIVVALLGAWAQSVRVAALQGKAPAATP